MDFEAKPGSKRSLGEADLFLPLNQNADTLLFANLRARLDDHSSREGNIGLGLRRMHESGWNFGVYGYFDRRRSNNDNYFSQTTLGLEALGRDWDFRANGYLPVGKRAHDLDTATTAAVSGAAIQMTTITREERALKGFDAEVGWRLPLFDADATSQLRVYAGGYRFSDAGIEVQGPRFRAELALEKLPWFNKGARLLLGLETQKDDMRGRQSFVSLRLRVPLGGNAAQPTWLTWQERRMTAPVMRDVDIVTQRRVASKLVESAMHTADGQAITVVNSSMTNGHVAIQNVLDSAGSGSTVLLAGTFNTTGLISMKPNQTLTGKVVVRSASGRTAAVDTGAAIHATNATRTIEVDSGGILSGLTITNTLAGGLGAPTVLVGDNKTNVTIANNVITVAQSGNNAGVALLFGLNASGTIRDNTLTAIGSGTATAMTALGVNIGAPTVTVTDNTISAMGGTGNYIVRSGAGTTFEAGSTGNIRGSGICNGGSLSGSTVSFTDGSTCP